jgi:hypothetical protein
MGLDTPAFQQMMATQAHGGVDLLEPVKDALAAGAVMTTTTQLGNLAIYACGRKTSAPPQRCSLLRLLTLFNYFAMVGPDGPYVDPLSLEGAFSVATSHLDRFVNVAYRFRKFMLWADNHDGENGIRVHDSIARSTGVSYEDWARCTLALNGTYSMANNAEAVEPLPKMNITAKGEPLRRWLADRVLDEKRMQAIAAPEKLSWLARSGYFELLRRPIVEYNQRYYLVNPRALDNALGFGLFFAALDAGNKAQDFFAFAGRFFEEYAADIVERLCARTGAGFSREVKLTKDRKSSDAFAIEGRSLVFFEMRFGKTARAAVEYLGGKEIDHGFQTILFDKIKQLDKNLRWFVNGELVLPGVISKQIDRLYPMIVLPTPFPRGPIVQDRIDAHLATTGYLSARIGRFDVAPLEIIEAESLEGLESLTSGYLFSALINEKVSDPTTRFTFFKNFLLERKGFQFRMHESFQRELQGWLVQLRADVQGWIL